MIIFLYGLDTYRSRKKLNEIIEHYKKIHRSGLNLKFLDLKEKSFENLKEEIQTIPMLAEKKLLIFRNASLNKNFKKEFLKNIKKFADSKEIFLFYEEKELLFDDFFESLKKFGKSQEFKPLEEWQLRTWLKKEFQKLKVEVEEKAIDKLVEFVGSDLWRMENEIKKIIDYKKGSDLKIKVEDIEILVKPKIETDIFKTIDAIASKDKKKALKLLKTHLEKGEKVPYLLSMIRYQFRNLLMIKDLVERKTPFYTLPQKTQLNPFVVKKSFELVKKFEISELKKIYRRIFQIELSIKTGKIEPEVALDLLITEI